MKISIDLNVRKQIDIEENFYVIIEGITKK